MAEDEVRAANEAFYAAFRAADAAQMEGVWASAAPLLCAHPGAPVIRGRAEVLRSWRQILSNPASPPIECSDVEVALFGDSAIVTCREGLVGRAASLVASNVFVREPDGWRMVHHHAGPIARQVAREEPDPILN